MLRNLLICSVIAGLSAFSASAQANLPPKVNSADQMFLRQAAEINLSEIDLAQLAQQNGTAEQVKQFAQRMITDHTSNLQALKDLSAREDITLPDQLSAKATALYARLGKLSGTDFDHAYINAMVDGHTQAATLFKNESRTAADSAVRAYAARTLPVVEEHLKMAHQDAVQIGATSRR
jgi:putative membrane protein